MTSLQGKLAAIVTDIGYLWMIAVEIALIILFAKFLIETVIKRFN